MLNSLNSHTTGKIRVDVFLEYTFLPAFIDDIEKNPIECFCRLVSFSINKILPRF